MKTPTNKDHIDLKDLEVKIEKYPMAESPNLLENFLIIGYEELYFQEVIFKNLPPINQNQDEKNDIKSKKGDNKLCYKEYKCRNLPTILGSISSNFSGGIFDGNQIIEKVFPIPPCVYYGYIDNFPHEIINVVFTNIQNNVVNIGYAYIFYETKVVNKLKIFLPKAFVIISQYPYFNIFNHLCKEVKKLYGNEQLQIPIEIQLYNIVNFVPAPVNSSMKMTLIPEEELFEINNKCKNKEDFFNLEKQEKYYLAQLSGYRCSDINFSELFSVLSVETIVEVYLELLSGKTIGFFSKHIEILNSTMYIFQQFFFPLAPNENVSSLSPTKFFCSENVDQYIVGFVCGYDDLEYYNPFRELKPGEYQFLSEEEAKKGLDLLLFKCDYILDLDKKILKEQDKYSAGNMDNEEIIKQNQKLSEYFKKVIGGSNNSILDSYIIKLFKKLKDISYKLTSYQHNSSSLPKFFHYSDSNELLNRCILDVFYQFNLNIASIYYLKISSYNGDYRILKEDQDIKIKSKEESGLSDDEYLFFSSFSNSLYCNVLGNIIGGYSSKEPTIYKTPKRIFEYLLSLKKMLGKEEYQNILDLYDAVYIVKERDKFNDKIDKNDKTDKSDKKSDKSQKKLENKNSINENNKEDNNKTIITFWEFYKYYFKSPIIANYFYNISNSEFVSGKINKNNKNNIKYTYKYKKIDLDQNLILKYINVIKKMDEETKKKCFTLIEDKIEMEKIISSNFISTSIEDFYIKNKLIDFKELIRFSILGIVALSTSKHKLVHFAPQIYEIIGALRFSVRKFVEIILSISLRLFYDEEDKNLYIYEKYFDVYKEGIEKRNIFPNDELIILERKINDFKKTLHIRKEIIQEDYKKLMETKEKNRYNLDFDKKKINDITPVFSFSTNVIKAKINFKIKGKKIYYENSFSILTIYKKITSILNKYYQDLDYSAINKEEYNQLIIYLLYFTSILKDDFPKDINLFLYYCLDFQK